MARFDSIKQTIDSNIKSNGNQEITGQKLNAVLNGMMSSVDAALTEVENTIPEAGEGAGNSVEAAILEFNSDGSALTAEQKAHNAEIYQKIFNNEAVQVYLNVGSLVPLQPSSISDTGITLSASAIITSEPSSLRYQSLKLSSDGDLQIYEQKEYPLGGDAGGEKELMQVHLGDLTSEQKAANVEVFNALAEGKGIIPYALYSNNIPMPFTNMIKWTVSGVADHFTLKSYNLDTLAEGKCSVVAVVINSDGTTSSSQSDINLPTGGGAVNSVEAVLLESNIDGSALTAEQKAHNAEMYPKIVNNETIQVFLNIGKPVAPMQILYRHDTSIEFTSIYVGDEFLLGEFWELSSDGDLQLTNLKGCPYGGSSEGGVAELMVSTTYADLVALRDAGNLVPGMKYRITDYETITTKEGSQSAGHPFDIIVTALDNKTISENASAIQSARDTDGYFALANLKAWQLKYALDNIGGRFDFAPYDTQAFINVSITLGEQTETAILIATGQKDVINEKECYIFINIDSGLPFASESEDLQAGGSILAFNGDSFVTATINSVEIVPPVYNSKGVIYRMIDAQGNSCPYDFKNIKFLRTDTEGAETYEYTFSYKSTNGRKDYSEWSPKNCYDNFMADGCWDNVFVHMLQTRISGNKFGDSCTGNTLGEENYNVIFGAECNNNTLAGYNNGCVFGNKCTNNYLDTTSANCIFGSICTDNKLGKGCRSNRFGNYFQQNTLGANCIYNSFAERCSNNKLGDECRDNHFGNQCNFILMGSYSLANTFGNECKTVMFTQSYSNTQTRDYNRYNVVDNGCTYVIVYGLETPSEDSQIQNVHIYSGIQGTPQSPVGVEIPATGNAYSYSVAKNSAGELKVYVEADLVQ